MATTEILEKEVIKVVEVPIESIKNMGKNKILVGHRNKGVYLYEISENVTEAPSRCMKAYKHDKKVYDCCYAEAADKLISVAGQEVYMTDCEDKSYKKYKGHNMDMTAVAINKKNNKIVTGSYDGQFIVWNTQGEQIERYGQMEEGHKGWINAVEFVPGNEEMDVLATASEDGSVKIWDLENGLLLKTFIDGQYIDLKKVAEQKQIVKSNTDLAVKAMCFSNDGSLIAYGGRNSKVYIINLQKNETLQSFTVPNRITALASGEKQPLIAIAIPDKILLWNIIEENVVAEYSFAAGSNEVYCYSMTFLGDELLIGLTNGKMIRLEISKH